MFARTLALGGALVALAAAPASALTTFGHPLTVNRPLPPGPVGSQSARQFPTLTPAFSRLGARYVGDAHLGRRLLTFHVQTASRNLRGLKAYAHYANTPGSAYYRRWLTPSSIAAAYGTPKAQYDELASYFHSHGLAVKSWKTRTFMTVTGLQSNVESAFGTKLGTFALGNARFYFPTKPLTLPLTAAVASISPITSLANRHLTSMAGGPPEPINGGFSNARVNGVTPQQLAEVYDLNSAYAAGFTGRGINLGIIGTGPISLADVPNYRTLFNVRGSSTVSIVPATVNGDTTPPPVTGPCTDGSGGTSTSPTATCNPEDIEAQLDTEQTSMMAPDSSVLFYLAYNGSGCAVINLGQTCVGGTSPSQGLDLTDDEMMQAVDDNRADILSLSFGGCETYDLALMALTPGIGSDATGTDPTLFAQLAAEGIATFVSSGDTGSAGCQRLVGFTDAPSASYPTTDPNVVGVGGTTTPLGSNGRLTGPITNWGQQTKSEGAAGAGTSILFNTPSFQNRVSSLCTMRCEPDVALNADPFSGQAVLYNSGPGLGGAMEEPVGGTSASTPDMAGMWAVVLSACKVTSSCTGPAMQPVTDPDSGYTAPASPTYRMGNPNYLWYPLLDSGNAAKYASTFYDITYGNDGVPAFAAQEAAAEAGTDPYALGIVPGSVSAGPGFDVASGLGFPYGRELIRDFVGI